MLNREGAPGPADEPRHQPGLRQNAHWAALVACVAGSLALCYSDYSRDAGFAQLAYPALIASGLFWLAELALAVMTRTLGRGLATAPVIALIGFGLVASHTPFQLAWEKSKGEFDSAAAELRQHPENAPNFHRKLGAWDIDVVQAEPGSGALYFEVAGDEPNRPVFASVPDGKPADWSSYRDCQKIDGDWSRCVWRF